MKIIMATGIFPPQIGGPALYCGKLANHFSETGSDVRVLTYGKVFLKPARYSISWVSRIWPYGLRQFIYFMRLLMIVRKCDVIFAFDTLGAGLPAVLAGRLSGRKVVMRIGGDFLWEKYSESGRPPVSLREFYAAKGYENYPVLFRLVKFVLRSADPVIFTTEFQRDIFVRNYGLDAGRTTVLGNIHEKESDEVFSPSGEKKVVLWAGRFLKLKNLPFLLNVFRRLSAEDPRLVLKMAGEGPESGNLKAEARNMDLGGKVFFPGALNEDSLSEEIKKSYMCVLPSLSEISPNFALKCLSFNKPVVITQETGIKREFPGLMYADPKNEESFYLAMLRLLDENSYDNYQRHIAGIRISGDWEGLSREYLKILERNI